jgi:hypothetical protein
MRTVPCRDSSSGVLSNFLSRKKSQRPCSGSPLALVMGFVGCGNCCFFKPLLSITERVCRRRGPVLLTAEIPRSLLLSAFHTVEDVENRATGTTPTHCDECAENESTASAGVFASAGRTIRNVGMTVMPGSAQMGCREEGCVCRTKVAAHMPYARPLAAN